MDTYVQCPYCLGYNTYRIPLFKSLDGSARINAPEYIERFPKSNCTPKKWLPINKQGKYNFSGFCNHCQTAFSVNSDLIIEIESGSKERWSKDFSMQVEDCFHINPNGKTIPVVTGQIIEGHIQVGDVITISSESKELKATVLGIEMFRKLMPQAEFEDNCGILLDANPNDICIGDLLSKVE